MGFLVVETNVARAGPICDSYVGEPIAIEVRQNYIARRPVRIAKSSAGCEMALAVVKQDEFRIRRVVAQHDIEIAVAVEIRQWSRVAAVGSIGKRRAGSEVALAIAEQHDIPQRP